MLVVLLEIKLLVVGLFVDDEITVLEDDETGLIMILRVDVAEGGVDDEIDFLVVEMLDGGVGVDA